MLSFLQPIWLYAITGIIAPIAIHFWNIKEGKAFPVGSIALLEKSTKKYTRTLRISGWLLLILRCLLIIFLAMLLAKPVRQQSFSRQKGWIILDRQNTNTVYGNFRPVVDSLLDEGYVLHRFDKDFEPTNLKEALASEDTISNEAGYWPVIKKLNNKVPASFPVYVFTSDYIKYFKGARPRVYPNVKWFAYTKDTMVKQIAKAWLTEENNIRVMLVNSASQGNRFSYEELPATAQTKGGYTINSVNGLLSVAFSNQAPVLVDTAAIHISICAGKNKTDGNYIKASLEAIHAFTKRKIEISLVNKVAALPQKTNWLFWLNDDPFPPGIAAQNIFKYESGEAVAISSSMNTNKFLQPIRIYKRTNADIALNTSAEIMWEDDFGNPLLAKEEKHDVNIYHFYSHFNPQWNDLVWNDAFPSLLLQLIFKDDMENINKRYPDMRIVDVQQIQTAFIKGDQKVIAGTISDLSNVCWFIIFLLFCAERIVSFSTKTNVAV